jgi:NAD(P)-dependent dehydrogenase (short-subunit alcohol dehydrogenase family)
MRHTSGGLGPTVHASRRYSQLSNLVAAFATGAARGKGSIINVSSMAGRLGLLNGAAYGATKAPLVSLTQAWTAEFSPRGVRMNAVTPGPVYTRPQERDLFDKLGATTPLNRAAEPAEIADEE